MSTNFTAPNITQTGWNTSPSISGYIYVNLICGLACLAAGALFLVKRFVLTRNPSSNKDVTWL